MNKLYKKENKMQETIEAYAECACPHLCSCGSGCKTRVGKVVKQFANYTASVYTSKAVTEVATKAADQYNIDINRYI